MHSAPLEWVQSIAKTPRKKPSCQYSGHSRGCRMTPPGTDIGSSTGLEMHARKYEGNEVAKIESRYAWRTNDPTTVQIPLTGWLRLMSWKPYCNQFG